jgi:hypothetical protein
MHHIEGAMVGLPLIFRRSGALPEYCGGFGEAFDGPDDVEAAVERMMTNYPRWKMAMPDYANTARRMADAYVDLLERLVAQREQIARSRRPWRNPAVNLMARWL